MANIKIKKLTLVNFMGVRELEIDFRDSGDTVILGDNETGKTTLASSFSWLLWGKDSLGRSTFGVKTVDKLGKPIPKLEHSVEGVLDVDGHELKMKRALVENWSRRDTDDVLLGHTSAFWINDVKCGTKKEYDEEVNKIIPEDVFRMITNPYYYFSMDADVQKEVLFDLAGTVSDDEVVVLNPDYERMLAEMNGRPLNRFLADLAASKRAQNNSLDIIPSQIETAEKLKPEAEDWEALESELAQTKRNMETVDAQLADASKIYDAESERKAEIQRQIGDKKVRLAERHAEIKQETTAARVAALNAIRDLEQSMQNKRFERARASAARDADAKQIAQIEKELGELREEFYKVDETVFEFDPALGICPTCKRPLDAADVAARYAELKANFNRDKSSALLAIQERGKSKKTHLADVQRDMASCDAAIKELDGKIEALDAQIDERKNNVPEIVDVEAIIAADKESIELTNEIGELTNRLSEVATVKGASVLQEKKAGFTAKIEELASRLSKREAIERADKEIAALNEQRIAASQKLAELESWEYIATSFQKDKDKKLMERINGMFEVVSFSFVSKRLNGNDAVTCVATVNGVPYPDVNDAGKLNAGLDVINAICKKNGVSAPIFVDNAERVTNILPTISQKTLLYVKQGIKKLTVK